MTIAWVIGARGMLGSAITRAIGTRPGWSIYDSESIDWTLSSEGLSVASERMAVALFEEAARSGESWSIIWAAGAGATSSSVELFAGELSQLEGVLAGIEKASPSSRTPGQLFYASSAGGVYAASEWPPFTEESVPAPISPYGDFKLAAERAFHSTAKRMGIPSLDGRIANLYGPGQRLEKLQGIISHIALARLTERPASIYVPLDTLRDYIYVDDCAALILAALDRLMVEGGQVTKILCSGQATTIATLLGLFRAVTHGRPRVVLGSSSASALQAHDLRLRSTVWPDLDRAQSTGLPAGISATVADILATIQRGTTSPAVQPGSVRTRS